MGARVTPPGVLVDVGGHRLHLKQAGPEPSAKAPTFVIEAGCGWHSAMYAWLQHRLSETTRTLSYDRAGLGWSDRLLAPKDAEGAAARLGALLRRADVAGPLFLIGHSIASLYLRVFAHAYDGEIVGVALLDPSHPDQEAVLKQSGFPPGLRRHYQRMALYAASGLASVLPPTGELRASGFETLPEAARIQLRYLLRRPQTFLTPLEESDAFATAARQAKAAGDLGDTPLLVLSATEPVEAPGADAAALRQHLRDFTALHEDLLSLSTNSRRISVPGANHGSLVTTEAYAGMAAREIIAVAGVAACRRC
jgi:pimeloyl-ACP methyl ester carboxylesterase